MNNSIDTILFDMDGTLLPMDQEVFVKAYFSQLAKKCAAYGYDAQTLVKAVWAGTQAMVKNDGEATNASRFWDCFAKMLGEDVRALEPELEMFYTQEFHLARSATSPTPLARACVDTLKERGYTLTLATNPIFPMCAQQSRLSWSGLNKCDFTHITSYENSRYCKPNTSYYLDILEVIGKQPHQCMMVGNNVEEDMCAAQLGIEVYLITDCIENPQGKALSGYRHGTFADFLTYAQALPRV